jgi:nucleotide-binding universal stress UspA family protein
MKSPILVASDGSSRAFGALSVAHALAARDDLPLRVVAVLEPLEFPGLGEEYPLSGADLDIEHRRRTELEKAVRQQLDELGAAPSRCTLTVRAGLPAPTIARYAAESDAARIVLGTSRTTPMQRLGASELPLRIAQLASAPVLVVPEDTRTMPRRAVVAIDFSDFSIEAARAARQLVGDTGEVHLVHVFDEPTVVYGWWSVDREWLQNYREGAEHRLERLARGLAREAPGSVRQVALTGQPAYEVLEYAHRVEADLIAAGTHGYGFFNRLMLGSESTRLLRGAECTVLLCPPGVVAEAGAPPEGAAVAAGAVEQDDPDQEC